MLPTLYFLKKSQHQISGISSITEETSLKASVIGLPLIADFFSFCPKYTGKKDCLAASEVTFYIIATL